jgi:hypothetical protein
MRNKSLLIGLLSVLSVYQQHRIQWCKIVPFQTTRAEIETMLGAPVAGQDYILSYDTADGRITIWYGGVKARPDSQCKWILPQDTVLSFVYAPKNGLPLSELTVDLTKFKKEKAAETANDFYYYNPADGLTLTTRSVHGKETLLSLERDPTQALREKYCKHP